MVNLKGKCLYRAATPIRESGGEDNHLKGKRKRSALAKLETGTTGGIQAHRQLALYGTPPGPGSLSLGKGGMR